MPKKSMSELLEIYFRSSPDSQRLAHLEHDVWRRIHRVSTEFALSWYDNMLTVFGMPKFQIVSIALAIVIGLSLSPLMPITSAASALTDDVIGLQVFSANAPHLLTTLLTGS